MGDQIVGRRRQSAIRAGTDPTGRAAQAKSASTKASGSNGRRSSIFSPTPTNRTGIAEVVLDREDDAALRRGVELGQHDAGQPDRFVERLRLGEAVLAGGRVEHEQRLGLRARAAGDR